jgi:predicted enzyme related to lactoylglutathione lyase
MIETMPNPFIHIELQTQDLANAKVFYSSLFNWRLDDIPGLAYTMVAVGDGTGGGMVQAKSPDVPSQWIPFVAVEDVHGMTQRVLALGGTIRQGPAEVPGYGWYSVVADPMGATFGIWKPDRR